MKQLPLKYMYTYSPAKALHRIFAAIGSIIRVLYITVVLILVTIESVQTFSEKIPPTPTKSLSQTSLLSTTPITTPTSSVDARDVQRQLRAALEENLQLVGQPTFAGMAHFRIGQLQY